MRTSRILRRALAYLQQGPALSFESPAPLPRRPSPVQHIPPDSAVLRQLYTERGLPLHGVAAELQVSSDTVARWLTAVGIPVRSSGAGRWRTQLGAPGDSDWDRFWRLVIETDDGCWLWQGKGASTGRSPRFWLDGAEVSAVHFAYAQTQGPVPAGRRLWRTCASPSCVAPAHRRTRGQAPAGGIRQRPPRWCRGSAYAAGQRDRRPVRAAFVVQCE